MRIYPVAKGRKIATILVLLMFMVSIAATATAQDTPFIIWVYDKGTRDSQFGYYDGNIVQSTEPIFDEYDIEGLACLDNTVYGASGRDGRGVSELFTVAIDSHTNQTTLTKIGDIQTSTGEPFYEIAALAEKPDGSLWGYANRGERRGIVRIDPSTAVGELVWPSTAKVEGVEWLGETLWLVGNHHFYTWTPGGAITPVFDLADGIQIEALDIVDGILWIGIHKDNRGIIALDPATGTLIPGLGFPGPDDIESLTFCRPTPEATPTATPSATASATPSATASATPSATPTATETAVGTVTPTVTATPTATMTPVGFPTPTETPPVVPTGGGGEETPTITPPAPTNEKPEEEPMPLQRRTFLPMIAQ
ncbi:MAG: hypothetical protein KF832_16955 [Caldilineaceae bacterium]|nr:hypothetical protein [Caldilineaceae bacterium]